MRDLNASPEKKLEFEEGTLNLSEGEADSIEQNGLDIAKQPTTRDEKTSSETISEELSNLVVMIKNKQKA